METISDSDILSPQLKYLLGNVQVPNQPQAETEDKCKLKADTLPDLSLAYLGPQIWHNMMLSDDLQLEPVDLDELLDGNALADITPEEVSNLAMPMTSYSSNDKVCQEQQLPPLQSPQEGSEKDPHSLFAMTKVESSSTADRATIQTPMLSSVGDQTTSSEGPSDVSHPTSFRIPTTITCDFQPNLADVIISTPVDERNEPTELFDPRRRLFTDDELKPQPIRRKAKKMHIPENCKDTKYWQKRQKNNIAAKNSREARRIKENQIAMRANFLEKENSVLKTELEGLRKELNRLVDLVSVYEKRNGKIE